jgi:adenylate cyclase
MLPGERAQVTVPNKKAVFLSYAAEDASAAQRLSGALRAAGIEVWFDQSELRGGDAWDAAIRRKIRECVLFVPMISANTQARGEGYFRLEWKLAVERSQLLADDQAFLLPLTIDGTAEAVARVPDGFRQRQWMRADTPEHLHAVVSHIAGLLGLTGGAAGSGPAAAPGAAQRRLAVCVMPFINMSGDPEQEYFSDGISEDIITDLSKVSALWVAARNTAFTFKGKAKDVREVARQLEVTHVLEGSVRKVGERLRITAQLIDGATGGHIWADRYDRKLDDIFALQDEIAAAIVAALKLKLLPEEKKAIERRGTSNPEAYKLYLMARQYRLSGNMGTARCPEAIIRLCQRATEVDPAYARPWALMAVAQGNLRITLGRDNDGGWAAAERALALDPDLAEAHAAKAQVLTAQGKLEAARREVDAALTLDPQSFEVNYVAGRWCVAARRFREAIPLFEKAAAIEETNAQTLMMLIMCLRGLGDLEGARRIAPQLLARAEKVALAEPDNGMAVSCVVEALLTSGEGARAKEWIERAILLDPDNLNMRYNFACTIIVNLRDLDAGLDLLEPVMAKMLADGINWIRTDPDLDPLRELPRFQALLAQADERLAAMAPATAAAVAAAH